MQKCKRGLDAFPSLQICVCLFISWPTLLLSVRFKIDLPSRWLESSTVASRRLQSNVISEVESQALFQRRERRLLSGSWIGRNHHHCWMSCDFEVTSERHAVGKKNLEYWTFRSCVKPIDKLTPPYRRSCWDWFC